MCGDYEKQKKKKIVMNRKLGGGMKLGVSWAGKCALCCFRACVCVCVRV